MLILIQSQRTQYLSYCIKLNSVGRGVYHLLSGKDKKKNRCFSGTRMTNAQKPIKAARGVFMRVKFIFFCKPYERRTSSRVISFSSNSFNMLFCVP